MEHCTLTKPTVMIIKNFTAKPDNIQTCNPNCNPFLYRATIYEPPPAPEKRHPEQRSVNKEKPKKKYEKGYGKKNIKGRGIAPKSQPITENAQSIPQ